jgi:hypothetical protein
MDIAAILAAPADVARRRAFAAALHQVGDPRALASVHAPSMLLTHPPTVEDV